MDFCLNLLTNISDGIACFDRSLNIIYMSDVFKSIMNVKKTEEQVSLGDLIISDDIKEEIRSILHWVMEHKKTFECKQLLSLNTREKTFRLTAFPCNSVNDKKVCFVIHNPEKPNVYSSLESEHITLFENLVENIPSPVYFKNPQGIYLVCNKAFEELSGYSKSEIINKRYDELFSLENSKEISNQDQIILSKQEFITFEKSLSFHKGINKFYSIKKGPVFDKIGKVIGIVGIMTDVTENRRIEIITKEANERLTVQVIEKELVAMELEESKQKLEEVNKRIKADLEFQRRNLKKAQLIQKKLNTSIMPNFLNLNLSAYYMPCEDLGGDIIMVKKFENQLLVVIGDCTGHGVEAAMDGVLLRSVIDRHIHLLAEGSPGIFISMINRDMIEYFEGKNFLTLFAGVINCDKKELLYANANGILPYVIRDNRTITLRSVQGMHVGFDEETVFEEKNFLLSTNDVVVFFSDAFKEVVVDEKLIPPIILENVMKGFENSLSDSVENIINKMGELNGGLPFEDDATLLALRIQESVKRNIAKNTLLEFEESYEIIENDLEYFDYTQREKQEIFVVLEEALTNAWEHGNSKNPKKTIVLTYTINGLKAEFSVTDEGNGFDPNSIPDPTDLDRVLELFRNDKIQELTHGRGVYMIKKYMNNVEYNKKGNIIKFSKNRSNKKTVFCYFN